MTELKFNPFGREVRPYVESIGIVQQGIVSCNRTLNDISEKRLFEFIADIEIDPFGLLDLVELLKSLEGRNGAKTSILKPVEDEIITHDGHCDIWKCVCGNNAVGEGFRTCDLDGDLIEVAAGSEERELYRCRRCGRCSIRETTKYSGSI